MGQPKWLQELGNTCAGVFAVDGQQRIVFWNKGAELLLGYSQNEVLNKYCYEVIAGKGVGQDSCCMNCSMQRKVLRTMLPANFELQARTKQGKNVRLNVSIISSGGKRTPRTVHFLNAVAPQPQADIARTPAVGSARLLRAENLEDGNQPRKQTPGSNERGLLLLDSSLNVIYANQEATQILTHEADPRKRRAPGRRLNQKVRSMLGTRDLKALPSEAWVQSGRRYYHSRTYLLNTDPTDEHQPSIALLLWRKDPRHLNLDAVRERFRLTPRERQAVELLAHGLTGKEIAAQMGVSPNTVKAFLRLVMTKMGVTTRAGILGKILESE